MPALVGKRRGCVGFVGSSPQVGGREYNPDAESPLGGNWATEFEKPPATVGRGEEMESL